MRPPAAPREIPPPLELECLKALWTLGEASVREVQTELAARRQLAYTTVMTVMDRLEKRGAVTRRKRGRAFIYAPKVSREALRTAAVRELVTGFFDGSPEALREYVESLASEAPGQASAASSRNR